jgi:two-component system sensor histidine kinase/response regulator
MMRNLSILLVEDDANSVRMMRFLFKEIAFPGAQLHVAGNLRDAATQLRARRTDLVLLDLNLPDGSGLDAFKFIYECDDGVAIILISGAGDERLSLELIRLGAQDYLAKQDLEAELLEKSIRHSLQRKGVEEKLKKLNRELELRVDQRTQELKQINEQLAEEVEERRKAERSLRESEARYRQLVENSGEGIGLVDLEDRFQFANPAAAALFGVNEGGLIGLSIRDFVSIEDYRRITRLSRERGAGGVARYDLVTRRPDNEIRTLDVTTTDHVDADGRIIGSFGIFRDITDQIERQVQLKHQLALENLLVQISSSFLSAEASNLDELLNTALARIGEFAQADRVYIFRHDQAAGTVSNTHEWCGKGIEPAIEDLQGLPAEIIPNWMKCILNDEVIHIPMVSQMDAAWEPEREILQSQGIQSLLVLPVRIGDSRGHFIGFDSVRQLRDWSQADQLLLRFLADNVGRTIHSVEQRSQLVKAKEDAQSLADMAAAANRTKSLFLANMSHEIRTPMNAILGFTQVLQHDPFLREDQARYVNTIARSGEHLLQLINDVLDMSKIEAGRLELNLEAFNPLDMVRDLYHIYRGRAESRKLELVQSLDEQASQPVIGDEVKLRQVLVNLLGNAIKFTATGRVTLGLECLPAEDGKQQLRFWVRDQGPGIDPADVEHLFEAFAQGEAGLREGGTGLGLAISRKLADLMGGHLDLSQSTNEGSEFSLKITLPVAEGIIEDTADNSQLIEGLDSAGPAVHVLVVDDKEDNRVLLAEILRPAGFVIHEAGSGQQALALFKEVQPLIVLMDLQMPGMNGYETTARMRELKGGEKAFILAVTANAFSDCGDQARAAGVDNLLVKPFRRHQLFDLLAKGAGLTYRYKEKRDVPASTSQGEPDFSGLSLSLLDEMAKQVESGDTSRLMTLIGRLQDRNARLAGHLATLTARYEYEELESLLERARAEIVD